MEKNIQALEKVVDLIKEFTDKNPIRIYKVNYDRIREKINQIKDLKDADQKSSKKLFTPLLKKLKSIVEGDFHPRIYFIVGGHGGIIIDDIGFCEFDSPEFALNRLLEKMELAIDTNMPYNIEIAISCLEWLQNKYPKKMSEFIRLFKLGKFEIINPSYAQPYNLIIGPESNIKQFEYGINILKELGLDCNNYYCSETSLHPQIPQILKGFNIDFCSLRTRLLGTTPTTKSGFIDWIGLDNTIINTLTDQSGVFNGEYWHGTFFREIPSLLFQAVSRPFLNYIVYSSIEDFIMPQSLQEEVWRISTFLEIFGKFVLCSELFQEIKKEGEFKYRRDDFAIGDYIYIPHELFLNNKKCESNIISAEIINCILSSFDEDSDDSFLDGLWKKLLLTQAHDNYAVPFMRPGDYSVHQLSTEEYDKLEFGDIMIPISELSLKIQKEILHQCKEYINSKLLNLTNFIEKKSNSSNNVIQNLLIFNPTPFPRKDIFSIQLDLDNPNKLTLKSDKEIDFQYQNSILKFIPEVPPVGYKIYSLIKQEPKSSKTPVFFYKIKILEDNKTIEIKFRDKKICELKFKSNYDYQLSIKDSTKGNVEVNCLIIGKINDKTFELNFTQYSDVNRLEFTLDSNLLKEIILIPTIKIQKSFINYPFGFEETKRSNIQTLDFLLLTGEKLGILFMQKNSQRFKIDQNSFEIRNLIHGKGKFEFAITITNENDFTAISKYLNSFHFQLLGIKTNNNEFIKKEQSFLSIEPPITLTNLWRRKNKSYLRILNSTNKQNNVKLDGSLIKNQLKEIDFNYSKIRDIKSTQLNIDPWRIRTFTIS